jgi:hypothetical protein
LGWQEQACYQVCALVMIRDEAGVGKIEWGESICPPMAAASALHSIIVWGGMCAWDAANGGKACWEARAGKNK